MARWVVILVFGLVAVALIGVAFFFVEQGLDRADQLSSVLGGFSGALAVLVSLLGLWIQLRSRTSPDWKATLERLAEAVDDQWSAESRSLGLDHGPTLPVRWRVAERTLMERPRVDVPDDVVFMGGLGDIGDTFWALPVRRVVVIGAAGAGKTTVAVAVTRRLLALRGPGDPVPVFVPVSTWNPEESLDHWLAIRLAEMYPVLRTAKRVPLKDLVLILDGLDEMSEERRANALRRINQDLPHTAPLLLTCRSEEYRGELADQRSGPLGMPIAGALVIELRAPSVHDVTEYLVNATPQRYEAKWAPVAACLHRDPRGPLAVTLATPLMAFLARVAYSETHADPSALLDENLHVEEHLLDQLVPARYGPRAKEVTRQLRRLARLMRRLSTPDLVWWQLSRALPHPILVLVTTFSLWIAFLAAQLATHGLIFALGTFLLNGAVFGLLIGLALTTTRRVMFAVGLGFTIAFVYRLLSHTLYDVPAGIWSASARGLEGALLCGIISMLASGDRPSRIWAPFRESPALLMNRFSVGLLQGATGGVTIGIVGGVIYGVADGTVSGLMAMMWIGGTLAVCLGIGLGMAKVLTTPAEMARVTGPGEVLRADRAATLVRGLFYAAVGGLGGWLLETIGWFGGIETPSHSPGLAAMFGVAGVLSTAYGRYLLVHACLADGRNVPWRFMAFLDDAHKRGVLRQVGAAYQFRHAQLQDRLLET